MSLERKAIRHALVDILLNRTRAGDQVHPNRAIPIRKSKLPALCVYTREEGSEKFEAHGSHLRTVRVAVELYQAQHGTDLIDDELDDFCEEVEPRVLQDTTLGLGYVHDVTISQLEVGIDDQGERLNGAARITFDVRYLWDTRPPLPPDQPTTLERAHVDYDLSNPDGRIEASDDINVP